MLILVQMCQTFMPHMPDGGRIVNVSSLASLLKLYQEDMRERFRTASTLAEVDELAHEYLVRLADKFHDDDD